MIPKHILVSIENRQDEMGFVNKALTFRNSENNKIIKQFFGNNMWIEACQLKVLYELEHIVNVLLDEFNKQP